MCVNKKVEKCSNASSHKLQPHFAVFLQYASANTIFHFIFILDFLFGNSIPSQTRPLCLRLTTISMHRETSAASVWLSRRSALSSSSARLPPQPPSLRHLLLLYLFLSESWFHLTWQSCGSHGRRCYKCSVTTLNMAGEARVPRQLSDAAWEKGGGNRRRCSASPPPVWLQPLSLIFNYNRQTALRLPCSAGLVLTMARENGLVGKAGNAGGRKRVMDAGGEINSWFFNNAQCVQFTVWLK